MGTLDLSGARDAYATYLLGDECTFLRPRLLDDGAGGVYPDPAGPQRIGPIPCGFTAVDGDEAQTDIVAVRGRYRLKLSLAIIDPESGEPILDLDTGDPFVPVETDAVEFAGNVYEVVWSPPPTALSLKRKLGLKDR